MFHHSIKSISEIAPILSPTHLDIWCFSLKNEPKDAVSFLNDEEIKRRNRLLFEKHQRRFGAAHAVTRLILSHYLQIPPLLIPFKTGMHGKPYLPFPYDDLQFNLSHSKELALLSVGTSHPNGIDIEAHSKRPYLELGENVFSTSEITFLKKQNEEKRAPAFFKIWSRKEAFIKANGMGLSYPLTTFNTTPFSREKIIEPFEGTVWKIFSFDTKKDYEAALCCHPSIQHFRYFYLNITDSLGAQ